jgi:hypothetical protein
MNLAQGRPDPPVPVGYCEPWKLQPTSFEISANLESTLLARTLAALAGQHDLITRGDRTHDREQRALAVLDARLHREAVSPPVDDRLLRKIPRLPCLVFEFEACVESLN